MRGVQRAAHGDRARHAGTVGRARDFRRRVACGGLDRGAILLQSTTTPLELTSVDPATGAATAYLTIRPPPLGLKSVDSLVMRADGSLYAYSYGFEISQRFLTALPA